MDNYVSAIAVQEDGKILIGGEFTAVNGNPRSNIARLNPDGSLDSSFVGSLNGPVFAIAVQMDGSLLVGGEAFEGAGGSPPYIIVKLNSDGSLDTDFTFGATDRGWVHALAYHRY